MTDLVTLQKWLQTFIVDPGSDQEALLAAERVAGLGPGSAENLVLPSPTLQPAERIQIYRDMYLLRMEEALRIDFPAVQHYVGGRPFFQLVKDYVQVHPSRSYTLDHLGRDFAGYLRGLDDLKEATFLGDLATIEWALCDAFNAPNSPSFQMSDLSQVHPEDFEKLVLKPIPSLQLLSLNSNANDYYRAWVDEQETPVPEPRTEWLAVWRDSTDFRRWRLSCSESGAGFLRGLMDGQSLGDALEATLVRYEATEGELFEMFSSWVGEGFFATYTFC